MIPALFSLTETKMARKIRTMKKLIDFTVLRLLCISLSVLMVVSCAHESERLYGKDANLIFRMDSSTNIRITSALIDTTSPESIVSSRWDKDYMRGTVYSSLSLE